MTFAECNEVIDQVVNEVYGNKYLLNYRLRQLTVIPDLENETISMIKEIFNAFSDEQKNNIYLYYTEEYFIQLITRKCQVLLINYTNEYKPKVS